MALGRHRCVVVYWCCLNFFQTEITLSCRKNITAQRQKVVISVTVASKSVHHRHNTKLPVGRGILSWLTFTVLLYPACPDSSLVLPSLPPFLVLPSYSPTLAQTTLLSLSSPALPAFFPLSCRLPCFVSLLIFLPLVRYILDLCFLLYMYLTPSFSPLSTQHSSSPWPLLDLHLTSFYLILASSWPALDLYLTSTWPPSPLDLHFTSSWPPLDRFLTYSSWPLLNLLCCFLVATLSSSSLIASNLLSISSRLTRLPPASLCSFNRNRIQV